MGMLNSLYAMRNALAGSVAFQTWVDASSAQEAKNHIVLFYGAAEDLPDKYCALYHAEYRLERQALGLSADCFVARPVVVCHFEQETDLTETTLQEALIEIAEVVDAIMPDIRGKAWFSAMEPAPDDPSMERLNAGKNLVTLRMIVEFANDEEDGGT